MDRFDFFYRQQVSESEVDDAFAAAERADRAMMADLGFVGMLIPDSPGVLQHGSGDLTVDVTGPASGYDQMGQRIAWPTTIRLDCSEDHNGADTAVVGALNSRYLSIVARFFRVDSDSRTDGLGQPVSYSQAEGYELLVFAGSEGTSPSRPSLPTEGLLLADVLLVYGQTQILTADILTDRRMEVLVTPALASDYADHVAGTSDRHTAAMIDATILATWADGTTNPAATVQVMLAKFITDLKATTNPAGAKKIGAVAQSGAQYSLSGGTLESQLTSLLAAVNANYAAFGNASGVNVTARGAWLDGETNPGSVSVQAALAKIITDLTNPTADHTGAARISGESQTHFAGSNIQAMLEAAEAAVPWKDTANTFSAAQTFANITASGTNKYKLASRSLSRFFLGSWAFDPTGTPEWTVTDGGRIIQGAVNTGASNSQKAYVYLDNIPHGAIITRIAMLRNPQSGHGAVPTTTHLPHFRLVSVAFLTGSVTTEAGDYTDHNTSSVGAYEAYTTLDSAVAVASSTPLPVTLDKTLKRYAIEFYGEAGANAVANLIVAGFLVTFTTTAMDDAAG